MALLAMYGFALFFCSIIFSSSDFGIMFGWESGIESVASLFLETPDPGWFLVHYDITEKQGSVRSWERDPGWRSGC
ncbi:hypothetical protein QBC44DRAFT_335674 [Cladorrhinum sp. PSN332]|nr:hypothetical protein QBC44DRAFT_335674 [Cladorrhinum sp. PSN332]